MTGNCGALVRGRVCESSAGAFASWARAGTGWKSRPRRDEKNNSGGLKRRETLGRLPDGLFGIVWRNFEGTLEGARFSVARDVLNGEVASTKEVKS